LHLSSLFHDNQKITKKQLSTLILTQSNLLYIFPQVENRNFVTYLNFPNLSVFLKQTYLAISGKKRFFSSEMFHIACNREEKLSQPTVDISQYWWTKLSF